MYICISHCVYKSAIIYRFIIDYHLNDQFSPPRVIITFSMTGTIVKELGRTFPNLVRTGDDDKLTLFDSH